MEILIKKYKATKKTKQTQNEFHFTCAYVLDVSNFLEFNGVPQGSVKGPFWYSNNFQYSLRC